VPHAATRNIRQFILLIVPCHYRCRGSSQGPARSPKVQVAAREVEEEVLRQLQAPGSIRDLSHARCFLENVAPLWPSRPRGEINYWVPPLSGAAIWNPDTRKVDIVFDEIGLENAMAESPELLKPAPSLIFRLRSNLSGRAAKARRRGRRRRASSSSCPICLRSGGPRRFGPWRFLTPVAGNLIGKLVFAMRQHFVLPPRILRLLDLRKALHGRASLA
jgi:hypothetical protein